jgi:hypothetical protein
MQTMTQIRRPVCGSRSDFLVPVLSNQLRGRTSPRENLRKTQKRPNAKRRSTTGPVRNKYGCPSICSPHVPAVARSSVRCGEGYKKFCGFTKHLFAAIYKAAPEVFNCVTVYTIHNALLLLQFGSVINRDKSIPRTVTSSDFSTPLIGCLILSYPPISHLQSPYPRFSPSHNTILSRLDCAEV